MGAGGCFWCICWASNWFRGVRCRAAIFQPNANCGAMVLVSLANGKNERLLCRCFVALFSQIHHTWE
jgi:hypothetical protein